MDYLFFITILTLVSGFLGGFFLLLEWLRHYRKHFFIFAWACALFLLNWFQIPSVLATMGVKITYPDFNMLFLWSTQFNFLAYLLIYFGIRSFSCNPVKKISSYLVLAGWFIAGLAYYHLLYSGGRIMQSPWELVVGMILFFIPVHILILKLLFGTCLNKNRETSNRSRLGIRLLIVSSLLALGRFLFVIYCASIYPPSSILPLARANPFYINTQTFGVIALVIGFALLHKEMVLEKNDARVTPSSS